MLKGVQHTASRLSKLSAGVQTNDTVSFSYFDLKVFFFFLSAKRIMFKYNKVIARKGFHMTFSAKCGEKKNYSKTGRAQGTHSNYI